MIAWVNPYPDTGPDYTWAILWALVLASALVLAIIAKLLQR